MMTFLRAGGFPMWIVLALGVAALTAAVGLVRAPATPRLATVRALSWATGFAVLAGVASDVMATLWYVAREPDAQRDAVATLCQGLGESLAPAVLGATILSVTWLAVAVAVRRAPEA